MSVLDLSPYLEALRINITTFLSQEKPKNQRKGQRKEGYKEKNNPGELWPEPGRGLPASRTVPAIHSGTCGHLLQLPACRPVFVITAAGCPQCQLGEGGSWQGVPGDTLKCQVIGESEERHCQGIGSPGTEVGARLGLWPPGRG